MAEIWIHLRENNGCIADMTIEIQVVFQDLLERYRYCMFHDVFVCYSGHRRAHLCTNQPTNQQSHRATGTSKNRLPETRFLSNFFSIVAFGKAKHLSPQRSHFEQGQR